MIYMFSGTPGSGKSLHLARAIKFWLCHNKRVISTASMDTKYCFMNGFVKLIFELTRGKIFIYDKNDPRKDNFTYIHIEKITPEFLFEYAYKNHVKGKEGQTLVALDECVCIFSPTCATMQDIKQWNAWEKFFQFHRHLGYDVFLIPQSTALISRKVKEYAEYEIRHRALKNAGMFGWIVSKLVGGLFSACTYWRGYKKHQSKDFFTFQYSYSKMYDSYTAFDDLILPYRKRDEDEARKILIQDLVNLLQERRMSFL